VRKLVVVALMSVFLVAGCRSEPENPRIAGELPLINLDAYESYGIVASTEFEYDEAQLRKWTNDPLRTDYVEVARQFADSELGSGLRFIDSADGTYNPRRVTIGTADGEVYALIMRRWHSYGGIWTVNQYARYSSPPEEGLREPEHTVKYELLDTDQAEQAAQAWAEEQIAQPKRGHQYLLVNGKVYILLTAAPGETVELIDVYGDEHLIRVKYANGTDDPDIRYGAKPYVLIRVDSHVSEISFSSYSTVVRDHPSLYIP